MLRGQSIIGSVEKSLPSTSYPVLSVLLLSVSFFLLNDTGSTLSRLIQAGEGVIAITDMFALHY